MNVFAYDREQAEKARAIAAWMYFTGTAETDNGSWCFYGEEVEEEFGIEPTSSLLDRVQQLLESHPGVAEITRGCDCDQEWLEIMFYLHYCGIDEEE